MKKSSAFASLAVCLILAALTLPAQQPPPPEGPRKEMPLPCEEGRPALQQPGLQEPQPALQQPSGRQDQKKEQPPGSPDGRQGDFRPGKPAEPPQKEGEPVHQGQGPQKRELPAPAKPLELRIPKAQGATTPDGWFDDWNEARAEARRTGRSILVLFTGSDWCHWCKVLKKNVLSTKEFKRFADQKLVLVYMDEPSRQTLPQRVRQTRNTLRQILQPGDGVPAIVLLTPEGKKIDTIRGYDKDLLEHLRRVIR